MSMLFAGNVFDSFLLSELMLTMGITYHINGRTVPEFYSKDELDELQSPLVEYASWKEIRPLCFDIIKGKKTPVRFQITLLIPATSLLSIIVSDAPISSSIEHAPVSSSVERAPKQASMESIPGSDLISHYILTIRYEAGKCQIISGCNYQSFSASKDAEKEWDSTAATFLSKYGIQFETE